jgi:hypothetical protein
MRAASQAGSRGCRAVTAAQRESAMAANWVEKWSIDVFINNIIG